MSEDAQLLTYLLGTCSRILTTLADMQDRMDALESRLDNHPYWSERWNEHFESEAQARSAHAMVNAERDWPAPFPEDAPQRRQRKAPRTDEGFFDGPNDNQLDI